MFFGDVNFVFFFFFSSRRRHTRFDCDWSSDVCSSDLKARQTAEEDAKQECQGHCTPEQLQADIGDRRKNALRELIDQSLLVQRGKDMGLNVEADVIKQLDQIRIQNKLDSMRSEEHTSELQSQSNLVCRLLLE